MWLDNINETNIPNVRSKAPLMEDFNINLVGRDAIHGLNLLAIARPVIPATKH
jgi:hypothetical protein